MVWCMIIYVGTKFCWLAYLSVAWLVKLLIEWSVDWFALSSFGWIISWLVDLLIGRFVAWFLDILNHWYIHYFIYHSFIRPFILSSFHPFILSSFRPFILPPFFLHTSSILPLDLSFKRENLKSCKVCWIVNIWCLMS